jgi:D-3-phosphoglycerate dehydrogenase / 2-oxoglutarate reductase
MPDQHDRWRRPVSSVAAAGGPRWRVADPVRSALRDARVKLIERPLRDPDGSVPAEIADADILISGAAVIDDAVLGQLRNVRFLLRPYVGYDDIDVDAVTRHGIVFGNVPDAFIEEVANHTMALILAGNRKLLETNAFVKAGRWSAGEHGRTPSRPIRRLSNLTLGLVGFGNIARLVVERARPFGFHMLTSDPFISEEVASAMGVSMLPLDKLLAESDIVSLHVFLSAETRHLIDARRLGLVKRGAYLVNTSRGPVVDEQALIAALQEGRLAGVGLDVFEVEPLPAESALLAMPNVILTSHIASYSEEGDVAHQQRTVDILMQVVNGRLPERKVVVNKDLYDHLAAGLEPAPVS